MFFRFLFALLISMILLSVSAQASQNQPVHLTDSAQGHTLHQSFSLLSDVEAQWNIDDFPALKTETSEQFLNGTDFKSIPLEMSRFWLTFDVVNNTNRQDWVMFIPMHLVNSIELVAQDSTGQRQYSRSGEDQPSYTRPFNDFGNSLPLTLRPNERYQVALLVHDQHLPTLAINELSLMEIEKYKRVSFRLIAMVVASLATMIVMSLFMMLLWWRIKDPTYGWYALFSLATFVIWAINYEFLRVIAPAMPTPYLLNYLAMAAMTFFSVQLSRSYLELSHFSPRFDRFYGGFATLVLAWMCVVAFFPLSVGYLVSALLALLTLPFLVSALFVTLRAGFRPARIYLMAWTLYLSNGTLTALDGLGMNLSTASIRLLTITSTAIGLIVMAYSVIHRIEQLRFEKDAAQEQARTDALTSLANRAAFEFDCNLRRELVKTKALSTVVFTYIDLDGLKKMNDSMGHHHGDQLLIAFANNLKRYFRDHDLIYRLGGDEFIIVFLDEHNDHTLAELIHERLDEIIRQLKTSGFPSADCSFGIASTAETDGSFKQAIKLADDRMYQHKRSKRTPAPSPAMVD